MRGPAKDCLQVRSGGTVKLIKDEVGVSQGSIARSVGVSPAFISMVFAGKRSCSPVTAQAIVDALGGLPLTVDMLFRPGVIPTTTQSVTSSISDEGMAKVA